MRLSATFVFAGGDAFEVDDAEVQPLLQPDTIHDADHLQSQHVLPQVFSDLIQKQTDRQRDRSTHSACVIARWMSLQPPGGAVFR